MVALVGVVLGLTVGGTVAITMLACVLIRIRCQQFPPIVDEIRTAGGLTVRLGTPSRMVVPRLRGAAIRAELFTLRRQRADIRVWVSVVTAVIGGAVMGLSAAGWTANGLVIGSIVALLEFAVLLPGLVGMGVFVIGHLPSAWVLDQHHAAAVWTFRVSGTTVTGHALHAWPAGSGVGTMLLGAASTALAARGFTVHANAVNAALARRYIRRSGFIIDRIRRRHRPRFLGVPLIKHPWR